MFISINTFENPNGQTVSQVFMSPTVPGCGQPITRETPDRQEAISWAHDAAARNHGHVDLVQWTAENGVTPL